MVTSKSLMVRKVIERIEKGTVVFEHTNRNNLFIEMTLNYIPLPKVYVKADRNENWTVICGNEIVSTIYEFFTSVEYENVPQIDINHFEEADVEFVIFPNKEDDIINDIKKLY